jgi:hypothetical protein
MRAVVKFDSDEGKVFRAVDRQFGALREVLAR